MTTKTKAILSLGVCFLLLGCSAEEEENIAERGAGLAADEAAEPLIAPNTDVTRIQLSAAAAQQFEEQSGLVGVDGKLAGGTLVLAGTPDDPAIREILDSYGAEQVEVARGKTTVERELEVLPHQPPPQYLCKGHYLKYVVYVGRNPRLGEPALHTVIGSGKLIMNIMQSVSASFSANVGIDAAAVTAGVNYDVTESHSISDAIEWTVPPGQLGQIDAYILYDQHIWEVWDDPCIGYDHPVGNGRSYRPAGVYFRKFLLN